VEAVLGETANKKIQEIPLSNKTVKVRIEKMSNHIEEQLFVKVKNSPYFALQCDESTGVRYTVLPITSLCLIFG
jgi:hypothetical protein